MKYMLLIYSDENAWTDSEREHCYADSLQLTRDLNERGQYLGASPLEPVALATSVRVRDGKRLVTDGPFAETREQLGGFFLIEAKDLDEAIDIASRIPGARKGTVEVRPVLALAGLPEPAAGAAQSSAIAPARIEQGRDLLIAGLQSSYTNESRVSIPLQWQRFGAFLGRVPGQVGQASYGVCWSGDGQCDVEYLTGVEVKEAVGLPSEFQQVRLPARRYAIFEHREHISTIGATLDAIWSQWRPSSGDQCDAKSPWFERYDERFNPQTGAGVTEIWIPLRT